VVDIQAVLGCFPGSPTGLTKAALTHSTSMVRGGAGGVKDGTTIWQ
jgi:hypothetical protein